MAKKEHQSLAKMNIEIFDENTLWDIPNLEIFTLYKNKLRLINEKTFEKNAKLREVDLRWNKLDKQ